MRRLGIVLVVAAACGDDGAPLRRDAQVVVLDDAAPDALPDAAWIDAPADAVSGTWSTPVEIPVSMVVRAPSMTDDRLELYFTNEAAQNDIYMMTRAATSAAWSTPAVVAELSSAQNDITPEVSGDGLTIHLGSRRAPTLGEEDIWVATRANRASAWGTPTRVVELSSTVSEGSPTMTADGLTIALSSRRDGLSSELYIATRTTVSSTWGVPQQQTALSTGVGEYGPLLSPDARTLYFDSTGSNLGDLMIATRSSTSVPFDAPQPITELNGFTTTERDLWVAPDGRYMIFVSNRGNQGYKLWETSR